MSSLSDAVQEISRWASERDQSSSLFQNPIHTLYKIISLYCLDFFPSYFLFLDSISGQCVHTIHEKKIRRKQGGGKVHFGSEEKAETQREEKEMEESIK